MKITEILVNSIYYMYITRQYILPSSDKNLTTARFAKRLVTLNYKTIH